ncbi:MAG TPA: methyl-accepting chemotaxis protein, partial [Kofleriaceae bacterium]|nr:methyl-accepting chemotaxis protein [Kofleriaceae bacterium]
MSWFANLRTSTKLMLGFAIAALASIAVGIVGLDGLGAIRDRSALAGRDSAAHEALDMAALDMQEVSIAVRDVLLADGPDVVKAADAHRAEVTDRLFQALDQARALSLYPEDRTAIDRIIELRRKIKDDDDLVIAEASQDRPAALEALRTRALPLVTEVDATCDRLNDAFEQRRNQRVLHNASEYQRTRTLALGMIGLAVLFSLFAGWVIARSLADPLRRSVEALDRVAAGDFTATLNLHRTDEVGQLASALDRATGHMRTALHNVRDVSELVASAAQELSGSAESISAGAQQQASSLEESAASIEEMTATIKHSADNARLASQVALGSRDSAQKGGQVVAEAVAAMSEINQASKKIAEIITAIDEIAFQTNLLALNAAVEAARAGEQGRGFAVVATEVRNLAQRSATAAKEIKSLIQDSVRKVEIGTELVNRSGSTLDEIVSSVKRVTDIVTEMASAAREQSSGIDQINQAITQMDQVTQSNASSTEEMSSTAQGLTEQAEQLRATVARFRISDDAADTAHEAAPVRAARPAGLGAQGQRGHAKPRPPRPATRAP